MFGRYAISSASFAGQSGNAFILSLTEDISLADSQAIIAGFVASQAEGTTLNNADSEQAIYYFGNVDAIFTIADTRSVTAQFAASRTENLTVGDTVTIAAQFQGSVTEAIESLDSALFGIAYFDSVTESLVCTDTRTIAAGFVSFPTENVGSLDQLSILAQFAVARDEAFAVAVHLETFGWIKIPDGQVPNWLAISDGQTPNWTDINDAQSPGWVPVQDAQ